MVVCTGFLYQNEALEYEHTNQSQEYRILHSPQSLFLMSYVRFIDSIPDT